MLSALSTIYLMLQDTGTLCKGKSLLVRCTLGLSLSLSLSQTYTPPTHTNIYLYFYLCEDFYGKNTCPNLCPNLNQFN